MPEQQKQLYPTHPGRKLTPNAAPLLPASLQYEEARKAHIRKLQADLARGATGNLVANSFQFNPDGAQTKEERIGLKK